jgi:16S rRNA (guanine(527)-N(7))-methyltransferase RsmG
LELLRLAKAAWPELNESQLERLAQFYDLFVKENEVQNLTRLSSPGDFVSGHLLDVRELLGSGYLKYPAGDLGSGGGVPGLLAAVLEPKSWALIESEGRKAQFLQRAVDTLGLTEVRVIAGRAESGLSGIRLESITARAVGSVEKIYGWLRKGSTWNNLVLLKGPKWDEEWQEFGKSKFRAELKLVGRREYKVGEEGKRRVIVNLAKVPRGAGRSGGASS